MPDTRPEVGAAAEHAYGTLLPIAEHDHVDGYLLLRLVAGLLDPDETPWAIVEDPGAVVALDPRTAPPEWLPLLAQAAGGRLLGGMTVAQQRAEVISPIGGQAGRPQHLRDVAAPHLQDGAYVEVRQRYNPDAADGHGHLQVRIRSADVLPGRDGPVARDVLNAVPAHIIGHVSITADRDYDEGKTRTPSYDAARTLNTDYDAARRNA